MRSDAKPEDVNRRRGLGAISVAMACAPSLLVLVLQAAFGETAGPSPMAYMLAAGFLLSACVLAPLGALWAFRSRSYHALALVLTLGAGWALLANVLTSRQILVESIDRTRASSNPIRTALSRFRNENGHFPITLEQLCPTYLPQVPTTGLAAFPSFAYAHHGAGYYLSVKTWLGEWMVDSETD